VPMELSDLQAAAKYSTLDIVKALDIPRERLRDWMVRGFIEPSLPALGKGTRAGFTRNDVYGIALFRKLVDSGFKRELASELCKKFMGMEGTFRYYNYVIFKIVNRFGKRVVSSLNFGGEKRLSMIIDGNETIFTAGDKGGKVKGIQHKDNEEWEDILIVNFVKLGKDVDKALSEL